MHALLHGTSRAQQDALKEALSRSPLFGSEYGGVGAGGEERMEPSPEFDPSPVSVAAPSLFSDTFKNALKESLARQQSEEDVVDRYTGYGRQAPGAGLWPVAHVLSRVPRLAGHEAAAGGLCVSVARDHSITCSCWDAADSDNEYMPTTRAQPYVPKGPERRCEALSARLAT